MTVKPEGTPTWSRDRRIGHYGGATDKRDCETEAVPYAWIAFSELQSMRSSAYSSTTGNLVDAENVAIARSSAARFRAGEKLATNSTPTTADERLGEWVEILRVQQYPTDTRQDIRQRCAAFYQLSDGAVESSVDQAVAALLGRNFVRNWRAIGSALDTPPPQTFALLDDIAVGAAGMGLYQLGAGVWLSERAHLTVEVKFVDGQSLGDFFRLVNVDLFALLDRMLPSHMTFNWAIGVEDGFVLDVSQLDFNGFGFA